MLNPAPGRTGFSGRNYFEFLALVGRVINPSSYLEIGTQTGSSLRCFNCSSIAVDPRFQINEEVIGTKNSCFFFQMGSDEFFREHSVRHYFKNGVDLSFLDGMHRFEYLLRDFFNVEASSHARSTILIHDCIPSNARMAERTFKLGEAEEGEMRHSWTGDVWRLLPILKEYRPDLHISIFDSPPTGLVCVTNLDQKSTVLADNYHEIVAKYRTYKLGSFGLEGFQRDFQVVKTDPIFAAPEDLTVYISTI